MYDVFSITWDWKKLKFSYKKFPTFFTAKRYAKYKAKSLESFSPMTSQCKCDSVMMIVGVFEKQFSKKYAQKLSKLQKNYKMEKKLDFADVIDPHDDVITSGTKFLTKSWW